MLASADRVWLVNGFTVVLLFVSLVVFASMHRPTPSFAGAPADAAAQQQADYTLGGAGQLDDVLATKGSSDARPTPGAPASSTPVAAGPASALAADGIPQTALLAYEQAALWEDGVNPACGITWPLLAGIGRVESDHGRFAGAVLHTDGTSSPPVIGIPLDGKGTALILDTDHGRLDGDTVYDRAVGPMQFIPSTWTGYGVDANHDGVADPFNIFDAAAAAARYLCAASTLTTHAGQVRAVLAYNHSDAYVAEVLALEQAYAAGAGVIVPTTSGPATSSSPPPALPPVDPGPPLGVSSPPTTSTSASGSSSTAASSSSSAPSDSGPSTPTSPSDDGPSTTPGPVVTPSESSDPPTSDGATTGGSGGDPASGAGDTGSEPAPAP